MIHILDNLEYCKKHCADNSIDLIYFNPPFGTTEQKWDRPLKWDDLFREMERILKPDGNIVIHSSIPFTYDLIRIRKPKYHWIWDKINTGTPFLAKKQPMRNTEEILVYYKPKYTGKYFPQMEGDEERVVRGGKTKYWGGRTQTGYSSIVRGKYPKHLITFKRKVDGLSTRPPELIEYIIKTYTNEDDVILDLTAYKGLTGKVAKKINRKYIGVDIIDWNL